MEEGDGEPSFVSRIAGRRGERAGAQRQAREGGAPGEHAMGDGQAGAAQAPDQRSHEHAHGDGGRVHADHSAGQQIRQAPAPGRRMPVCAGRAGLRPAPGLRRRDHRHLPLEGAGRGQALRVGGRGRDLHPAEHDPPALQRRPGEAGEADLGDQPDLQQVRAERSGADRECAGVRVGGCADGGEDRAIPEEKEAGRRVDFNSDHNLSTSTRMTKDAIVSDELAKKFATEKESPYTRWVKNEGLDIISSFYVPSLHTVELKPWARRGGNGVYLNHDASRTSNDCYVCEIPPGKSLAPQRQLFEEMIYVLKGGGSTTVWNDAGQRITFEWKAGALFAIPLNAWHQHFNGSGKDAARFVPVAQRPRGAKLPR